MSFTWEGKLADLENFFGEELKAEKFEGGNNSVPGNFLHYYDRLTGEIYEAVTITMDGVDRDKELQDTKAWTLVLTYGKGKEPQI